MKKQKILIVDDNHNNLFTLKSLLDNMNNCEIIQADSGTKALEEVLKHDIDLILLDIQMPELDGFEVAKMLKSSNETKEIPIIFLTAVFKEEEFIKKGFKIGATDYLTKPIDNKQLLDILKLYNFLMQYRTDCDDCDEMEENEIDMYAEQFAKKGYTDEE
jgi:two-component system, sensor histidine kinase and response regulator